MWRTDSFKKTLMLGKIEGRRRRGRQRVRWLVASATQWAWVWAISGSWWWTGKPGVLQSMGSQRVRHNWATELKWFHWFWPLVLDWHRGYLIHGYPEIYVVSNVLWGFLVAQIVNHLPAMQNSPGLTPCQEGPIEKGMATHSSILAWRIPWTEEPGGPQPMG